MSEALTPILIFPANSPYSSLVIKREDQSETGSHKFRYLKSLLKNIFDNGMKTVVLSTTGNAGITASHYGTQLGIQVICLMAEKGDMNKAAQIEADGGVVIVSPRPFRFAKYISKKYDIPFLRASKDDQAVEGYVSLGDEIISKKERI